MDQKEIKEKIEKGYLNARIIIEILGTPKEHIEKTIRDYVKKIKEDKNFIVLKDSYSEPEIQENLWATFVELEMLAKNIQALIGFCFDYMPASIEIIEPENLMLKANNISDLLNDMQARLHQLDLYLKSGKSENNFLKRNLSQLIKNMVSILTTSSPRSLEELSKITGIPENDMEAFLKHMVTEGSLEEKNKKYSFVKKFEIKNE